MQEAAAIAARCRRQKAEGTSNGRRRGDVVGSNRRLLVALGGCSIGRPAGPLWKAGELESCGVVERERGILGARTPWHYTPAASRTGT